ncbi:phosphotransferase [Candidatus Binatia bacterium]|nr:phosphotransferase [Candidatus Binatia bacterium]
MTDTTGAEVPRDIEVALERLRIRARRIELVSPLGERKGVRIAYRVDTDDGRTVKLRHFGSASTAEAHLALRAGIDDDFAPASTSCGPVLFEAWIEGNELIAHEADRRAAEAGALLGRLHARPLAAGCGPVRGDTARWRAAAQSDLAILHRAGSLSSAEVAGLEAQLARRDPGSARTSLIHKDFCAENMVVDGSGRLRVIDNEQLEIGPSGFDLGRTFHRWPMSAGAWVRFLGGYRSTAPEVPEAIAFWKIAATLVGARVFLERMPERLDAALALLRRFVAGVDLEDVTGAEP